MAIEDSRVYIIIPTEGAIHQFSLWWPNAPDRLVLVRKGDRFVVEVEK